jgi:hypoxanthine phosphoribosyltransferase
MILNGATLINALTIIWIGTLIFSDPFGSHLILTIGIYSFVLVALVNHLFPKQLSSLTHVVKALYSFVLFFSVNTIDSLSFLILPLMMIDLFPLFSKRLAAFEGVGAALRLSMLAIGFYQTNFNLLLISTYLVLNYFYFKERSNRIQNNRRYDYGWTHCYEHLSIFIYLFVLHFNKLNLHASSLSFIVLNAVIMCSLILGGILTNLYLKKQSKNLPPWFDRTIEPFFHKKMEANLFSKKIFNYCMKPFAPTIWMKVITWRKIEAAIQSLTVKEPIDEIVGILSGGAFIAPYVAKQLNINKISYVHSTYWSKQNLPTQIKRATNYLFQIQDLAQPHLLDSLDVAGKTILLIDDSVCSSTTINSVTNLLYELKAKKVIRYSLFCSPSAKVDYAHTISQTPLIWPWGWECD